MFQLKSPVLIDRKLITMNTNCILVSERQIIYDHRSFNTDPKRD